MAFEALRDQLAYRRARLHMDHEQKDLCSASIGVDVHSDAAMMHPEFATATKAPVGATIIGGGKVLKDVRGMGRIYDWRTSPWTPANGGRINPIIFVQHIPVVPNMTGIADFVRLRDVLVAQGLMVQNATDRDGNIALYTPMNVLCYQARGANQISCGTEHMHMSVGEAWTKRQLRASAWLVNQAKDKHGIPAGMADLEPGDGIVRVARRGQTSHRNVSDMAGYHDRTDPGDGYDWEYVYHCVLYYREHLHFEGA